MWFSRRRNQCEHIDPAELTGLPDSPAVAMYVNRYLLDIAARRETQCTLKQSQPLWIPDGFQHEVPAFTQVASYLKTMAGLEPATYQEPRDGMFYMMIAEQVEGPIDVDVRLRFDDREPDPTVLLTIEYHDHIPSVVVPEVIWQQVQPWADDVALRFDVRLTSGRTLRRMAIDQHGTIIGQIENDGVNASAVNFIASDIRAIRRRAGSILSELGLSRWLQA